MFVKLQYICLLLATLLESKTEAHVNVPMCSLRHLKINEEIKNRGDLISSFSFFVDQNEPRA